MSDEAQHDIALISLLERALELEACKRREFIVFKTQGQPELAERALKMLKNLEQEDDEQFYTGHGLNRLLDFHQPDRIGNYKIIGEIGRGGMGIVYKGRRADADFEHEAAIKLVSITNTSSQFIERLRSERRLLARLKHPNIAQLYDGGELENGAPFFIMELVDGVPLHHYLKTASRNLKFRLGLFEQICSAISYAHTNTIVHRDLSPANILVNKDGLVKVIDFGISSSISDLPKAEGAETARTKGYSAPEFMQGRPANTLGDIFSLGKILIDITENTSNQRAKECNAIIAKATHRDPEHRYASVDALWNDLDNMSANRPVVAMDGGKMYRLKCLLNANKFAVTAAVVLLTGVISSSIVFAALYFRAVTAEEYAQARFNEVRNLASFMMFEHYDNVADLPGSIKARAELAEKAHMYLDQLSLLDDAPFSLKVETASGFRRLADLLGNPQVPNLGRRSEAEIMLNETLSTLIDLHAKRPRNPPLIIALADTYYSLSVFNFIVLDDSDSAFSYGQDAEKFYREYVALMGNEEEISVKISAAMRAQSNALVWMQEGERAIQIAEKALSYIKQHLEQSPSSLAIKKELSNTLTTLGYNMTLHADNLGLADYETAVKILEQGIDVAREIIATGTQNRRFEALLALNLLRVGTVYYSMDREPEAIGFLNEAKAVVEKLLQLDPNDQELVRRMNSILKQSSMTHAYLSNFEKAFALSDQYIENQLKLISQEPDNSGYQRELANGYGMRGEVAYLQGHLDKACRWYLTADEQYQQIIEQFKIAPMIVETERRFILDGLRRCIANKEAH